MQYEKCLVELDEILNQLNVDDLNSIPKELRQAIQAKKDKKYNWVYNKFETLNEQNIDRKTLAMLSYINMEYLLDKEQSALMKEIHKSNDEMIKNDNQYIGNDIFRKETFEQNKKKIDEIKVKDNNVQMIVKKECKWYSKLFKKIIGFFSKK